MAVGFDPGSAQRRLNAVRLLRIAPGPTSIPISLNAGLRVVRARFSSGSQDQRNTLTFVHLIHLPLQSVSDAL